MNGKGAGFVIGLIVGIILVMVLIKMANKDRRIKTEYDERQEKIRGKAYKYAFYTMIYYQVILIGLSFAELSLPIDRYVLECFGIFLSCTVLGGYCVWHDVYWGLNNDHRRYYIVFGVCLFLNLIPVIVPAIKGEFAGNGLSGAPMLNLMVIFMMVVLLAELGIKHLIDKKTEDGED
ncbi:MAG: hypothetical protein IJT37_04785 [Lachnospiraceae bacterium]|nr:hypothetical protein [Lachnospiraceae bacterium]